MMQAQSGFVISGNRIGQYIDLYVTYKHVCSCAELKGSICLFPSKQILAFSFAEQYTAVERQTTVTVYFSSKQLTL